MSIHPVSIYLKESFFLTPNIKHFIFELDHPFSFIPGQFITIHFQYKEKLLHRSYSIANASRETNHCIEFAASYVKEGPASELLFNLKPSECVTITGPFGRLILKEENYKRYILIGTSTGITPYRAMLSSLSHYFEQRTDFEVFLLEGVQKQKDLLYSDEFNQFASSQPRFNFKACYSKSSYSHLQSFEHNGYVQSFLPYLALNPSDDLIYLCGNPNMIDDTVNYLKTIGFDTHQIRREKYLSK